MSYQFITSAKLPTRHGEFDIHIFENDDGQEHVMLTVGLFAVDQNQDHIPDVRQDDAPVDGTASVDSHSFRVPDWGCF